MTPVNSRSGRLVLAALLLGGCQQRSPDGVALVGATLIDGSGGPVLRDAAIVVRRGRIESVGSREGFELPRKTREVDVSGRWIIPGLIDAHAHVVSAARWAPGRYLAWGVTTVREMHGGLRSALALRKRYNNSSLEGPRIYAAGPMIDGRPTTYPDAMGVNTERDARKSVDQLVSSGMDLIKVYTRIDQALLRAIVDEARAFHLGVSGHLGMTDAVTAAKLGIAAIEHMSGVPEAASRSPSALYAAHYRGFFPGWTAFERSWADLDSAALTRVAGRLAETRVTMVPTLVLHETLSRLNDPAMLQDPAMQAVPEAERQAWDIKGMIARAGWSEVDFQAFRRSRPKQDLFIRAFVAAGGRIAAGTDASSQLLVPGHSEHRELELLVHAGLTARQALQAGTRNGALLIGVDSIGLLAPGKAADLLVLRKDPMADIRNTRSIEAVMARGYLLDADSIRAAWRQ